jgi:hypothetical protein
VVRYNLRFYSKEYPNSLHSADTAYKLTDMTKCIYTVHSINTNANSLTPPETQQLVAANRQAASNNPKRHPIVALVSFGSVHCTITEAIF